MRRIQRAESGKRRQIKREIFVVNFENIRHKHLLFKQPICASLKILIFFSMSIVAVQHIHTSSLRASHHASLSATIYKEERLSQYILKTLNLRCSIFLPLVSHVLLLLFFHLFSSSSCGHPF